MAERYPRLASLMAVGLVGVGLMLIPNEVTQAVGATMVLSTGLAMTAIVLAT